MSMLRRIVIIIVALVLCGVASSAHASVTSNNSEASIESSTSQTNVQEKPDEALKDRSTVPDRRNSNLNDTDNGLSILKMVLLVLLLLLLIGVAFWKRKWLKELLSAATKSMQRLNKRLSKDHPEEIIGGESEELDRNIIIRDGRIRELEGRIRELEVQNRKLVEQKEEFHAENIALGEEIADYKYNARQAALAGSVQSPQSHPNICYADAIINGYFNRITETPNEDTIFELYLRNEQTATFTAYGEAYRRIIANHSFLEGCDKQVLNNARNVKIEGEGSTQRQIDGKWKIIKKLSVIID